MRPSETVQRSNSIQDQVKLPPSVAFGVVLQGIKIRFGRSMVTVLGVVLGIAFLMSILTGQIIKDGVSRESRLRTDTKRMYSFLISEMGNPREKIISVISLGSLNEVESRLLHLISAEGVQKIRWVGREGNEPSIPVAIGNVVEATTSMNFGDDTSAVLILGKGKLPAWDYDRLLGKARQKVVAISRKEIEPPPFTSGSTVVLEREMNPEELAKQAKEESRNKFRGVWIILISLIVTVIGITNSMLMSVTERFKEIGTMKCLGALSSFIRQIFLIESSIVGLAGSLGGCVAGCLFSLLLYGFSYGYGTVLISLNFKSLGFYFLLSLLTGVVLSVVAALYPARIASKMVPAVALRTNI